MESVVKILSAKTDSYIEDAEFPNTYFVPNKKGSGNKFYYTTGKKRMFVQKIGRNVFQ